MTLLALDLATTTGWASGAASGAPRFGAVTFAGNLGQFAFEFDHWLQCLLEAGAFEAIYVEAPLPLRNKTTLHVLLRLYWAHVTVLKACFKLGLPVKDVRAMEWRQHFIGVHRAPMELSQHERRKWLKRAVIGECNKRGWSPSDDNAADALGLLSYALEDWKSGEELECNSADGPPRNPRRQSNVIKQVKVQPRLSARSGQAATSGIKFKSGRSCAARYRTSGAVLGKLGQGNMPVAGKRPIGWRDLE